jgi:hypothetical protein
MRGDQEMIKKKDTQVKTVEKGKRIIIILVGIAILMVLYYGILKIQMNYLYRNVKMKIGKRIDFLLYNMKKIFNTMYLKYQTIIFLISLKIYLLQLFQ